MKLFENVRLSILEKLEKLHMSLSHLWILENSYLSIEPIYSLAPESIVSFLDRKGYISYNKEKSTIVITPIGRKLYELLSDPNYSLSDSSFLKKELKKSKSETDQRWKEWIGSYPVTASWTSPLGTIFKSTRRLRIDSLENEKKYLNILAEGEYTHEDMCNGLKYQIDMIRSESTKINTNKFEYMQQTSSYLNQGTYKNFIEDMKTHNWKPKEEKEENIGTLRL